MGITVSITSTYLGETQTLEAGMQMFATDFIERFADKAPIFELVSHNVLEPAVMEQFDTEGDAGNTHWKPLEPATNAIREREGYPRQHPILERSGELRNSFKAGDTHHIEEFGPDSGMWGSNSHGFHQIERDNQLFRTVNPARPILYWNETLKEQSEILLHTWGESLFR